MNARGAADFLSEWARAKELGPAFRLKLVAPTPGASGIKDRRYYVKEPILTKGRKKIEGRLPHGATRATRSTSMRSASAVAWKVTGCTRSTVFPTTKGRRWSPGQNRGPGAWAIQDVRAAVRIIPSGQLLGAGQANPGNGRCRRMRGLVAGGDRRLTRCSLCPLRR